MATRERILAADGGDQAAAAPTARHQATMDDVIFFHPADVQAGLAAAAGWDRHERPTLPDLPVAITPLRVQGKTLI